MFAGKAEIIPFNQPGECKSGRVNAQSWTETIARNLYKTGIALPKTLFVFRIKTILPLDRSGIFHPPYGPMIFSDLIPQHLLRLGAECRSIVVIPMISPEHHIQFQKFFAIIIIR